MIFEALFSIGSKIAAKLLGKTLVPPAIFEFFTTFDFARGLWDCVDTSTDCSDLKISGLQTLSHSIGGYAAERLVDLGGEAFEVSRTRNGVYLASRSFPERQIYPSEESIAGMFASPSPVEVRIIGPNDAARWCYQKGLAQNPSEVKGTRWLRGELEGRAHDPREIVYSVPNDGRQPYHAESWQTVRCGRGYGDDGREYRVWMTADRSFYMQPLQFSPTYRAYSMDDW